MNLDALLDAFKSIKGFPELQREAQRRLGRSGTSFEELKEILQHAADGKDADEEPVEWATELYQDLRISGRRQIALFPFTAEYPPQLRDINVEPSVFSEYFPFEVPRDVIERQPELRSVEPALVRTWSDEQFVHFAFCSIRQRDERVDMDPASIDLESLPDALEGRGPPSSVVYIWKSAFTAVDVVSIPHAAPDFVLIQTEVLSGAMTPTPDQAENRLRIAFLTLLDRTLGPAHPYTVDLFRHRASVAHLPNLIYFNESAPESSIFELKFRCGTGALRKEQIRTIDLREENYHEAGMLSIGTAFNIARLGVMWRFTRNNGQVKQDAPGTDGQAEPDVTAEVDVVISVPDTAARGPRKVREAGEVRIPHICRSEVHRLVYLRLKSLLLLPE
jgi:hypothetical protein